MTKLLMEMINISKNFGKEIVLNDVSLNLYSGQSVCLVGTSGSGKSTLLHIAGLLDIPSSGCVMLDGVNILSLSDTKKTHIRNKDIGFIYQFHNLLSEYSVLENVMFPMWIQGVKRKVAKKRALELLDSVDILEHAHKRANLLSGGQAQRVAIARALANNPRIILADEPTGNLDDENTQRVWGVLMKVVQEKNISLLCVTHDMDLANKADKIVPIPSINSGKK